MATKKKKKKYVPLTDEYIRKAEDEIVRQFAQSILKGMVERGDIVVDKKGNILIRDIT